MDFIATDSISGSLLKNQNKKRSKFDGTTMSIAGASEGLQSLAE
jgi:hypothetical protein